MTKSPYIIKELEIANAIVVLDFRVTAYFQRS